MALERFKTIFFFETKPQPEIEKSQEIELKTPDERAAVISSLEEDTAKVLLDPNKLTIDIVQAVGRRYLRDFPTPQWGGLAHPNQPLATKLSDYSEATLGEFAYKPLHRWLFLISMYREHMQDYSNHQKSRILREIFNLFSSAYKTTLDIDQQDFDYGLTPRYLRDAVNNYYLVALERERENLLEENERLKAQLKIEVAATIPDEEASLKEEERHKSPRL